MSDWKNVADGEQIDAPRRAQHEVPAIPMDQPKVTVTYEGGNRRAPQHWAWSEQPSDYEIRKDALNAAATYCNRGGFGGMEKVVEQARVAERYLRGEA